MRPRWRLLLLLTGVPMAGGGFGCASGPALPLPPAPKPAGSGAPVTLLPGEAPYLSDLRQLTFGGENAEAYWSFDGKQLSFQARHATEDCDRIYRMNVAENTGPLPPIAISPQRGAATCAHFFPSGDLLFASTMAAGDACPPRPDMSKGYVWAVRDSYDIYSVGPGGERPHRLTTEPGYDAEGTVCGRDGSIIFTSARDGDIDLYRMDKDGAHVKRLTRALGYDGGAFFNHDCTKIVWRASRPRPGKEQDDYKVLLAEGLVRPSKMELWIADADGNNPMQLTTLGAASFAPSFHPSGAFIIFSSNHGDPGGREFDLWTIHPDGTGLHQITFAKGFDGFPHFSPDGKTLAFSSNRATPAGAHDTDVFAAKWRSPAAPPGAPASETPADRIARDIAWLADPAREGRGAGTKGLEEAGAYLETRLRDMGVQPAGDGGGFREAFPITTSINVLPGTDLKIGAESIARDSFSPLGFSANGKATGALVLANYGIVDKDLGIDDYAGRKVKGKIVLVRRFAPENPKWDVATKRRLGDIRGKAWLAREHGAKALLIADWPSEPPPPRPAEWQAPPEAPLLPPGPEGPGDAGLPVIMVKRAVVEPLAGHTGGPRSSAKVSLTVSLAPVTAHAFNVVGLIPSARPATPSSAPVPLILGAHYDHLGYGSKHSMAPEQPQPHLGADDNASGTAAVLEIARDLMAGRDKLARDVLVVFFSGEESGLLGSSHFVRARGIDGGKAFAMFNLDMVGRLRGNQVDIMGANSATEWRPLISSVCGTVGVACAASGDGIGPSDQAAFYGAGLPVLHFFTGTHSDYHRPSDNAARINAAGTATVALLTRMAIGQALALPKLSYVKTTAPAATGGDLRSFRVSLGTMPDYAGPPGGAPGVLLAGVRPGGGADLAGMRRGDILVRLGMHQIRSVEDLMYVLNNAKAGDMVTAIVIRDGAEVRLPTTFQEAKAAPR